MQQRRISSLVGAWREREREMGPILNVQGDSLAHPLYFLDERVGELVYDKCLPFTMCVCAWEWSVYSFVVGRRANHLQLV